MIETLWHVILTNMFFLFRVGKDKQRNPHCIKTTETDCDLTNELDIKGVYTAEVLSESLRGMTSDHVEPPFTRSKTFCPYNDSKCPTMHSQPAYHNMLEFKNTTSFIQQILI